LFEVCAPEDLRPRRALEGLGAFVRGELAVGAARTLAFAAHAAAREVTAPSAVAAARAAGQAVSTAHMGAHAVGAAVYAARAVGLASATAGEVATAEAIRRQVAGLSDEERRVVRRLPPLGGSRNGPLASAGLLGRGSLRAITQAIQGAL
jgi:hypothetical protein